MKDSIYPQIKIIETKEYILRPIVESDAEDLYEYYSQEKVVRFLPFKAHKNITETRHFINSFFIKNYKDGKIGHWGIVSKKEKKVIGNIGFNNIKINSKTGEIGICVNPKYWGHDISTILILYLVSYAFDYLDIDKIIAITYGKNIYSQKSLENMKFIYIGSYNKKIKYNSREVNCNRFELTKLEYSKNKKNGYYKSVYL